MTCSCHSPSRFWLAVTFAAVYTHYVPVEDITGHTEIALHLLVLQEDNGELV